MDNPFIPWQHLLWPRDTVKKSRMKRPQCGQIRSHRPQGGNNSLCAHGGLGSELSSLLPLFSVLYRWLQGNAGKYTELKALLINQHMICFMTIHDMFNVLSFISNAESVCCVNSRPTQCSKATFPSVLPSVGVMYCLRAFVSLIFPD